MGAAESRTSRAAFQALADLADFAREIWEGARRRRGNGGPAAAARGGSDRGEGAVEFGGDVVDVLEADGVADELGEDAALAEVFVGELGVGGGGRGDDQRLRVADICQQREDFAVEGVRERARFLGAALDAEDDHAAGAVGQVLGGEAGLGERGIFDPGDLGVLFEEFRDGQPVLAVARDAEGERFDALQEDPGGVRANVGPRLRMPTVSRRRKNATVLKGGRSSLRASNQMRP